MKEQLVRQSFLGPNSDKALDDACAAIVGLCGGGSHVAQQLAHAGVGEFCLFDHDRADEPNRNRMVGLTADDAKSAALKTDVISRLIKGVNPEAKVHQLPKKWQEEHLMLRRCTAIIGCVDSFSEREQLERYARRFLIPYIDVGMEVTETEGGYAITGQVILSLPGHPCMRCMGFLNDKIIGEEAQQYGAAGGKPQVVWPNGTLASVAVGKFMSLLTLWQPQGILPPLYTEYDGNRFLVRPSSRLELIKEKSCDHFLGKDALGDTYW